MCCGALRTRGAAIGATLVLALLGAPAAEANSIWVTDGNMSAGASGGCGAFDLYGDLPLFAGSNACPTGGMSIGLSSSVPAGENAFWMTTAPAGITINQAWTQSNGVSTSGIANGWAVGDFWQDIDSGVYAGSTLAPGQEWFNTALEGSSDINSQIYGIQLVCTHSAAQGACSDATSPDYIVAGVELQGTENTAPTVTGLNTLWNEPAGQYVWNPPGDPWMVVMSASDVSGICTMSANVNGIEGQGPTEPRDNTFWQQCPTPADWHFNVDTRSYVPASGSLPIQLNATNAAGIVGATSKSISVDNDPVTVSFSSPNDPNPTVWVGHAVTVDATATAGPSGVSEMHCSTDGAPGNAYPTAGVTVDGDGTHDLSCTAANNAVDPQGQPNTGTSSIAIDIDEAPPSLTFERRNPGDPTGLVVDATDSESGVAGGSIEMAPAGSSEWTTLPTTFDGSHLLAHFDDADRTGTYTFRATACDNVGNCASASEAAALPVRAASDAEVSLTKIVDPLRRRTVTEQVRVDWHWATIHRNGKVVRVKRGGHLKTIKVVKYVEQCTTSRARTGRVKRACRTPSVHATKTLDVPYGKPVTVHGVYTTSQGAPLAGQPVQILAAPNNGLAPFSQVATVTTAADGTWAATLPSGPSRLIRAVTDGSATILPSSGQVTTIVPARIRLLKLWPRRVAWGGTVHLVGQLLGGYLPPDGALVRLRIGYGSTYNTYGVQEHVTGNGRFSTVASFGPGDPTVHRTYWFQIASLPMGNYPYAPAASHRVTVTVGGHPRAVAARARFEYDR